MRTAGAFAVALAACGIYTVGERERKRALTSLREIVDAIRRIAGDIRTYHAPLPDVFARLGENAFFARLLTVQAQYPEAALYVSFQRAAENFPPEEREILTRLGGGLVGDEESLQQALAQAERELTELLISRRMQAAQTRRIRAAAVFSLAALLLLLLL